jgi:hypothetical protein
MRERPVTLFAILGALLFLLSNWLGGGAPPHPIAPADLDRLDDDELLYRAALARGLDREDPVVQARLIRNMRFLASSPAGVGSLYGDALRLGMADGDLVVRRRLIERMRLLLQEPALAAEPSEAELQVYLDTHAASFASPATVRLTQIFLGRAQRGAGLAADAARLLERLGADDVGRAAELADPLPLPVHLPARSQRELERLFGRRFAAAAFAARPGRWLGPLPSPYGLHLVWVHARGAARPAELQTVRARVRAAVREARAAAALRDGLRALRAGGSAWQRSGQAAPQGRG